MDFNAIIKRVIGLVTKPKEEWQEIKKTDMTVAQMFTGYAMILAAIPAIAGFLGFLISGLNIGMCILWAILMYIFSLAGVYLLAFIIDVLAPSFGSTKNMVVSLKIVIFSYTASWVAGIFYIIPSLTILAGLISLYTLFLLYLGMEILKEVPKDKMVGYFVVTIIVSIIIYFLIGFIVTRIALGAALRAPVVII